jgi:hypothetical protein
VNPNRGSLSDQFDVSGTFAPGIDIAGRPIPVSFFENSTVGSQIGFLAGAPISIDPQYGQQFGRVDGGFDYTIIYNYSGVYTGIPEPTSWCLLIIGLVGVGVYRHRCR